MDEGLGLVGLVKALVSIYHCINKGGSHTGKGFSVIPAAEIRVFDKLGKIGTGAIPSDGVSWHDNKQHHNDSVVARRKGPQNIEPLCARGFES